MAENKAKSGDFSKILTGEFPVSTGPVPFYQDGFSPDVDHYPSAYTRVQRTNDKKKSFLH